MEPIPDVVPPTLVVGMTVSDDVARRANAARDGYLAYLEAVRERDEARAMLVQMAQFRAEAIERVRELSAEVRRWDRAAWDIMRQRDAAKAELAAAHGRIAELEGQLKAAQEKAELWDDRD